ncbi:MULTISPECIES: hypothetical protein [Pseudomonas]|uniref:Uncharacterized protein n=1 Tax=Pseudomonas hunanensis TaxID=1247546 RepID=A0ACC6K7Y5_9PSED|nr:MULTISPECIES: hypothetical protein [Pseudomonas]MBP2263953.1 hypothetical protein [Pseudomonas sp. BP8]MDR6714598.1 hypothetical protein [Pseudomonas hunanensis]HDS1736084.1 hypothetical protein [Pseudomonas putida]
MKIEKSLTPLTLIAIFAGIIEASALASLPFLSEKSQTIYTWFLVGFPFFLTVLFFLTLNFNHQSLYLPGPHEEADRAQVQGELRDDRIIALSGPEAGKMIEAHVLRCINQADPQAQSWTLFNLETRIRIGLSVSAMASDEKRSVF